MECYQDVIPLDVSRIILSHLDGVDTIAFALTCKDFCRVVYEKPVIEDIPQALFDRDLFSAIRTIKLQSMKMKGDAEQVTILRINISFNYINTLIKCGYTREFVYLMTFIFNMGRSIPITKQTTYLHVTEMLISVTSHALHVACASNQSEIIGTCKIFGLSLCIHAVNNNFRIACMDSNYKIVKSLIEYINGSSIIEECIGYVCRNKRLSENKDESTEKEDVIIDIIKSRYRYSLLKCWECGNKFETHPPCNTETILDHNNDDLYMEDDPMDQTW